MQKFCFYFLTEIFQKFDNNISITRQQTSKWQTHLTYGIAGFQCSVTLFNIDQNKNQNRSIDKVQNLENERRYMYKDPRQDSGQRNISYMRYPKKCFTQTYRNLYGNNNKLYLHDHNKVLQHCKSYLKLIIDSL